MAQNDNNRDRKEQGEGYQDPNEQESLDTQTGSDSERQRGQSGSQGPSSGAESDLDDADEMDDLDDEDRDDDQREGGTNRRRNIS
jgi:hypothetical protein